MVRPSPSLWTFAALACSITALLESHLSFRLTEMLGAQIDGLEAYVRVLERSFSDNRRRRAGSEVARRRARSAFSPSPDVLLCPEGIGAFLDRRAEHAELDPLGLHPEPWVPVRVVGCEPAPTRPRNP